MNIKSRHTGFLLVLMSMGWLLSCQDAAVIEYPPAPDNQEETADTQDESSEEVEETFLLPEIDLSNWKVTLPVPRSSSDSRPLEIQPPEILDYATNEQLLNLMYNDSTDGSLVFYTYPGATTTNATRSRTELREQLVPRDNSVNWSFADGGKMTGRLAMGEISKDASGDYHRTIIMQIHGRLSNEQRDRIGASDNNAPPVLKIYWYNGKVRVKTKVLVDENAEGDAILPTSAWTDDEGFNFSEEVGFDPFTLSVEVSEGFMKVSLNESESIVYQGVSMDKWGIFENYFKAGNYLQTNDEGAFARVKYYSLEVEH